MTILLQDYGFSSDAKAAGDDGLASQKTGDDFDWSAHDAGSTVCHFKRPHVESNLAVVGTIQYFTRQGLRTFEVLLKPSH